MMKSFFGHLEAPTRAGIKIVLMVKWPVWRQVSRSAQSHNAPAVSRPVRNPPDFPERRPFCALPFRDINIVILRFSQDYKKCVELYFMDYWNGSDSECAKTK